MLSLQAHLVFSVSASLCTRENASQRNPSRLPERYVPSDTA